MLILNSSKARTDRRGSMLLLSLLVIFSLMVLSGGIFFLNKRLQGEVTSVSADRRARYLAEAGIAEGMTAMRTGASGAVGTMANPAYLADGLFWVQADNSMGNGFTQLTSVALTGSGRAALQVLIEDTGQAPLFPNVLNSREQLTVNADVMIDSYDSSAGTYASQAVNTSAGHTHASTNGDVSSNKDVIVNANAHVFGDATPGPGYNVTLNTGSVVTGSITPAPTPFAFPPIQVPTLPPGGPQLLANGSTTTIPSGNHRFTSLSLGKAATLIIQGPADLVVDDFVGGKDARLVIDASAGPVTIYVRNSYSHISGFESLAAPGSPMALAWMIEATQAISFPSASKIRGAFYAPNADITFTSNNEAWGSFAGNRVSMSSSMKFHYDEVLSQYWNSTTGQNSDPLQVRSWQVTEVTPAFLKNDRRNPFVVLGLAKNNLNEPYNAWLP